MRIIPRPVKFWLINWVALPFASLALRLFASTWRFAPEAKEKVSSEMGPNGLLVMTFHGQSPLMIPGAFHVQSMGRQVYVLTSPSRDGLVLDRLLKPLGVNSIKGSSSSKAAAGAIGLIRQLREGHVAIIAGDGPRGPIGTMKTGFVKIARETGASFHFALFFADRYWVIPSWDRLIIPKPFAKISLYMERYPIPDDDRDPSVVAEDLRRRMLLAAREKRIPIFCDLEIPNGPNER